MKAVKIIKKIMMRRPMMKSKGDYLPEIYKTAEKLQMHKGK